MSSQAEDIRAKALGLRNDCRRNAIALGNFDFGKDAVLGGVWRNQCSEFLGARAQVSGMSFPGPPVGKTVPILKSGKFQGVNDMH